MKPGLIEIVAGVLNVPPDQLTKDSGPKNCANWDSLAHVTIVAAVEQTFGVVLAMSEILSIHTIADIQELVRRHGVEIESMDAAN